MDWLCSIRNAVSASAIRRSLAGPGNASGYITSILEDSHNRIWVGTVGTGLFRFDPANGRFATWGTPENGLGNETISTIRESRDGKLWVATEGNGVYKFDPLSKTVSNISRNNSGSPMIPYSGLSKTFAAPSGLAREMGWHNSA